MKTNERSELLLGKEALETLNDKTVLVVGVGGVAVSYTHLTLPTKLEV